jgi:hypothetical protein
MRAFQKVFPDLGGKTLALVEALNLPPPSKLAASLVNELSGIEHPFILALDDYQSIREQSVHDLLSTPAIDKPQPGFFRNGFSSLSRGLFLVVTFILILSATLSAWAEKISGVELIPEEQAVAAITPLDHTAVACEWMPLTAVVSGAPSTALTDEKLAAQL